MKTSHTDQIFEMMADGVWQVDAAGKTVFVNSRMHAMLGYSRGEFMLLPVLDFVPEDARAEMAERIASRRHGVRDDYECQVVRKDGSLLSVRVEVIPLYTDHGEYDGNLAIVTDLTKRQEREETLRQSEARTRLLVEAAKVGLWDWDLHTNEAYLSPEWKRQLGYADHEVANHFEEFAKRLHPSDRESTLAAIADFRAGRSASYKPEFRMRHRDGSWRWILAQADMTRDTAGNPVRMMGCHIDITESKEVAESLRRSEERLHLVLRGSQDAPWDWDLRTHVAYRSPRWWTMLGHADADGEFSDASPGNGRVHPDDRLRVNQALDVALKTGRESYEIELRLRHKDGHYVPILARGFILRDPSGMPIRISGTNTDLTERKQAEERRAKLEGQLQQAQKMESIGRLAGGIAHDFNNMLTAIFGYTELAMEQVHPSESLHEFLEGIRKVAGRSADLTRQLLAFARKQLIAPKVLNPNDTLAGMMSMLQRLIGEDIRLTWRPGAGVWPIKADQSQLNQILTNLCVNARHAIAGVGKLLIETGNITIDMDYCASHGKVVPGDYVRLTVSDDGCGMDKETFGHLFEPFFTTRPPAEGTGLGLATIFGIIQQNRGFINVHSELGRGATFMIYLPRHVGTAELTGSPSVAPAQRGHETILLVEDDPSILKITKMLLERLGYAVLAASTPAEAMRLGREHQDQIHLLLTDVIMPEMNGSHLAKNLQSLYPGLKCLFMSGFTAKVIAPEGLLNDGIHFIQKPFSSADLSTKVRKALDLEPSFVPGSTSATSH